MKLLVVVIALLLLSWTPSLVISLSGFSTNVLQEILKQAIPDCLVRDTDLFSLRFSNKKMTTANTAMVGVKDSKMIPIYFCQIRKKIFIYAFWCAAEF